MSLTKEQRAGLPDSEFAVPSQRKLPIHDKEHVVMAWSAAAVLPVAERADAQRVILRKAHTLGVDTSKWHLQSTVFQARSVDFGSAEHSNRLPFSGVLTYVDEPSDNPVGGAGGKRVIMTRAAAESALDSLLGMAVDFKPDFDGHAPKSKIGIITSDEIVGNELRIAGYFWAADFPEEVALISKDKDKLGFSYECRSMVQSPSADPLVVAACEFTGAAVLYKDKAAYMKTSLAARADQSSGETKMDKDLQDALTAMSTSIAGIPAAVATAVGTVLKAGADEEKKTKIDAAKASAATLRASAASLKVTSPTAAAMLEAEAGHIEGFVAKNEVPPPFVAGAQQQSHSASGSPDLAKIVADAIKPLGDAVGSMATKMVDMEAKLGAAGPAAQRKTLNASSVQLLEKAGIKLDANGDKKVTIVELDAACAKAQLPSHQSMALKMALKDANLLDVAA